MAKVIPSMSLVILLSLPAFSDSIHFYTQDRAASPQYWNGKILSIANNLVVVRFRYRKQTETHSIHISRVLSIIFNDLEEHSYEIRLRPTIADSIPGDLARLRQIYFSRSLSNDDIKDAFGEIALRGTGNCFWARGNIVAYDPERSIYKVRIKMENGQEREISSEDCFGKIRLWVR